MDCPKCHGFVVRITEAGISANKCLNCGWYGGIIDLVAEAHKREIRHLPKIERVAVRAVATEPKKRRPRRESIRVKPEFGCTKYNVAPKTRVKYYCGDERTAGDRFIARSIGTGRGF